MYVWLSLIEAINEENDCSQTLQRDLKFYIFSKSFSLFFFNMCLLSNQFYILMIVLHISIVPKIEAFRILCRTIANLSSVIFNFHRLNSRLLGIAPLASSSNVYRS